MKYKSIDLFAGIGGIRMGFDNAFGKDIETVYVCEWDEFAQKRYREYFHDNFDIAGGINLAKAGRKNSPVLLSMKSIGLVDAMVSILMLEIALIDTFGDISTDWARTMMAVSGSCVWVIAMAIGVFGIRWYMRKKV